ncbi:MAG: CDGSH iron-sulfur domain-containing protein [Bacteroidales bacterium]|jgi:CDGSH-type Zn-finger protein|nr:CDGSH iron-sulfur domain-containing protein [Bacteroidales bacterium]
MEDENKQARTLVEVIEGGPLKVSGNFILKDLKRDVTDNPTEVYLCRCGRSASKPFCDGSHRK